MKSVLLDTRGGCNFGVVTSFEYRLHPVGPIPGGMVVHPMNRAKEALQFFREFTAGAPDELTPYAIAMHTPDGMPVVAIALCYCGLDLEEGARIVEPLHTFGPPITDLIRPMAYTEKQGVLDAAVSHGQHSHWKANQLDVLSDDTIDTFLEHVRLVSSPRTAVLIEHHHGAMCRVAPDATTFRLRK